MPTQTSCYLSIHAHFYQPPRTDPFTGHIPREPDAAPYANWNERITAECYTPNAEAGNFESISFNLGATLARWLDDNAHTTYERIVASERAYSRTYGIGNGLAQPVHHTILPLARRRDKTCQVRWGIASFRHRFGHEAMGMWLPEMAVDHDTLETLVTEGVHFTILSDQERLEGSRIGADTLQRMTVTGKISTAPMRGVSSWPGMGPSLWTLADAGPSRLVALSKGGQCLALVVS